jgi:dTDP-glucose pyrophosphorylase
MKQINLIPLAGAGSRFIKEGYKDPKPLIMVDNIPMIIRAAQDLPNADEWVFICRTEHIKNYPLNEIIEKKYPGCKIIDIDYLTEGQASTCLLGEKYIDKNNPLLIGACDNGIIYNKEKFNQLIKDEKIDVVVFSFRNNVTVERNPKSYGWIKTDNNNNIIKMSVKVPISDNPKNDHAVVGTFWFRKGKNFIDAAKDMMKKNIRINNEFYVDECINNASQMGLRAKVFEVDKYICWGSPNDLRTYNYWKEYFKNN